MELGEYGNRRVLVVDDQPEIHDDFTEMLKPGLGDASTNNLADAFSSEPNWAFLPEFELLHATSGEEACDIVRAAKASNRPIAVIYVDVRMPPGIDGVETTRRMRAIDSHIEVVLMTAYADKSLFEITHDMASLHKLLYIRKPFSREEIQQITLSLVIKWNLEQTVNEKQCLLAASHRRLEAVLDATGDAMAMYDAAGQLVFANKAYEELCGMTEGELRTLPPAALAARFEERFQEPDLPELENRFLRENQRSLVQEVTSDKIPTQRLFYQTIFPVWGDRQDVIGHLRVYRDMSREIEIEQMKAKVLRLNAELEMTYSFDGIIGGSPKMRQMYALMQQAMESDITVLIRGESGTGKELVARSFHFSSSRKSAPFLAINCAALPETLIETELFGHERGAFTGAMRRQIGVFERAEGGTVFLDEVGAMQPALQTRLLRVLQERKIRRIGGTTTHSVNVRVIAVTNSNLEEAVRAGTFREDLFYRLAAFPIFIPPLRERREDIPALANHFLKKYTERSDKMINGLSTAVLRILLQYDWPGNVRELENAIKRAILLETTEVLQISSLPPELSPIMASPRHPAAPTGVLPLLEVERQAIAHALEAAAHNVTDAARSLGIDRTTLYRKLKKYGVPVSN